MTIVDSLKRLAKTITGKDLTGETVAEVVDELNDNYPEGGGSGNDDYIVHATASEEGGEIKLSVEESIKDILAAAQANKNVYVLADAGVYVQKTPLTAYGPGPVGLGLVTFGVVIPDMGGGQSEMSSVAGWITEQDGEEIENWKIY